MPEIKSILCPTDFSPASEKALAYGLSLARQTGSKITLLHVVQVPFFVGLEDGPGAASANEVFVEEARREALERLRGEQKKHAQDGLDIDIVQLEGPPHERIVEAAKDKDLLVMGTHGRTGLPHLLLGSVAERVVRMAPCPVLTVPSARAQEGAS